MAEEMIRRLRNILILVVASTTISCEKLETEMSEILVYEEGFDTESDWKISYDYLYSELEPEPTVHQDSGLRAIGNNIRESQLWLGSYTDIDEFDHNWAFHDVDESQLNDRIKSATALIIELDIEEAKHSSKSENYFELTIGKQAERWTLPDSSNFSVRFKLLNSAQAGLSLEDLKHMNFDEAMMNSSSLRFAFRSDLDGSWQNCQMRINAFKVFALIPEQE